MRWTRTALLATAGPLLLAVAGIGAGTVAGQPGDPALLRQTVLALYDAGNMLGRIAVCALLVAVLAGTVALIVRHGPRVLPGSAVLAGAGYSFLDSHIFWPRGVWTMVAFAAGFGLWTWAAARSDRDGSAGDRARGCNRSSSQGF